MNLGNVSDLNYRLKLGLYLSDVRTTSSVRPPGDWFTIPLLFNVKPFVIKKLNSFQIVFFSKLNIFRTAILQLPKSAISIFLNYKIFHNIPTST